MAYSRAYDVAIIGGGIAGLSNAVLCDRPALDNLANPLEEVIAYA